MGSRRLAVGVLSPDHESAERMEIAAQNAQGNVTLEAQFAAIATSLQTISTLQSADGRLDTRMTSASFVEADTCASLLLGGLFGTLFRKAGMGDDLRQLLLVLWRMKSAVE